MSARKKVSYKIEKCLVGGIESREVKLMSSVGQQYVLKRKQFPHRRAELHREIRRRGTHGGYSFVLFVGNPFPSPSLPYIFVGKAYRQTRLRPAELASPPIFPPTPMQWGGRPCCTTACPHCPRGRDLYIGSYAGTDNQAALLNWNSVAAR